MQDEPPPPPPPPPVDSRSRSLSSNPAAPGPLRAGGRAPTFSELRAGGLSSRSSSLHVDVKDDDPLSPRTRLEMEKQRQAMGKTTATSSGLNMSAANTSNTTPTNHSSTRSTPRSSSFYSVSSSLEFAPTGGRRFDLQTQHRNPSNQLSPHRAMLSRVDSLLGSQPPSGPSPGASSQYGGASFVATHSMYSASSTSTSPSLATSTRTFHRERGEEQREPSSCGAEILYNSPIRLRLSSRQCLRISAVKDSNHQSHATSHLPPRPTGSGTGTGGSAGIARTSRPSTTVQINVSGDGLDGDADQIFVLQNTALRSDCGEVHYSDIVSLYCVGGSCKGQFLSVDPATQTLTMKKGPVISNSEKWRLVNPISEGREDYPVNNQDSFASVDAASRLWGQQKAIATSDSVMLKMNTAELYLSVRPDRYGQDDSTGTHTASVVLSKENDGINDTMQVWKVTKSNLPYDPEWNRERPYLTGEAFVQPQAKRHHTADDGDLNLPPLSTYPPSVQESIIVDDLLYILLGVEGRYIKLAVTETRGVDAARSTRTFKFGLNKPGMDPSLLTLASRCLSLGEFYLNLSLYIEQFSRYEYGQVSHAFCAALKTLVKEYKIMVGQLEHLTRNVDGAAPFTIQKLWYNVQPSLRTLEMLSLLVDGCRKTIGGGSLLSEIQRIMSSLAGDSNARKVFSFLMERASVPYLKMVERWIYHGDLVDPYDEFMIRRDDQVSKEDVQDNPYSTYWQSRYTIRASQVPLFLSRVAQKILTAGKYLNVFRTCSRQVDCPFAGEIVFSPSESVYEELIDKAHGFASRVLLDLFVRENDLQNRLISLKHYFLMDQGDFFVDFMDVAEVELKLRADKLSLPRLESLLHLSLQTSTCSSDPYKDDLQCFLSPHNLISHMEAIHQRAQKGPRDSLTTFESSSIGHPGYKVIDAFTLDYNVKWPLSLVISCGALTKYQMIFRHIFFCKHVERQLCDAWMNHQATKELSLRAALGPSFCLRQRMLHFQQNFVYYMMFEVISPRWHDFQQQLASAGTVDDILEFQGEFLDICLKECLLTDPELLRVLTRLMMVCMTFANSIESYTRPYFLDEETIKAEREAERDRRAEKKAREEAEVALASYQRQKGTFGGKKKGGVLRRRQSSQVDMRRTRIRELSDDVKRALTEREGDEENPFVRMTNDLENQFDSLLGEFMQQLLRRSLLQQNSHLSNLCTRLDYNGFYTKSRPKILNQIFICKRIWRAQYTCVLLVAVCLLLLGASAKQLTVLVQPLISTAGESLSVQPVLALTDDNGNILTTENDGTVIVSIGNNPSRFAGIYPLASAFTFENGIARCSGLYINEANVGFTLVFSSYYHGVRTETSSFDVVVGPRYRLAILADISTAYGGTPFLPQPTAGVVDKGGNVVAAVTESSVRIEIEVNPVGGVLQPAALLNVSIVGGIARFRGAFIDVAGSPYKLRYTTDLVLDGGSTVVTNPFTVAAGECSRLQFNTTLGEATGGKAFLIQPVLKLLDSGGNVLEADSSSRVRVTIAANPSRGTLTPADGLTVRVQKGVATFRSLKIDKAGNGYSLQFTLYTKVQGKNTWEKTTISQVSDTFDILTGNPVSLLLQRNLSDGILDGQPNEIQPIVALLDSGGNVVSSLETGTVTASLVSSASVSSSIVVDTSAAPLLTVVNVRALINSAYPMPYGVGARVSVQVTFSDEVSIKGAPTLELESSANGAGANGKAVAVTTTTVWSSIYVFEYDVVATDNTLDLEYTSTTALSLNGGLITDRNGNTPILTLPALGSANSLAGTSAVVIDTTAPVITSVSCPTPGDGEYGTGQQINLSVQFSQPVSVYGNPLLPVALTSVSGTGGTRNAVFSSGNNTNTLVFIYTVQSGDAAAKLDVMASINVNGGFIKHCSQRPTTDAVMTMAAVPVKLSSVNNIVIDTATPTIDATVGVTSGTSNGIYAPGDEIKILITFTKPVTVTGYPRLFLETGPIKRPAGYTTGSGTKVLTLVYRVSAGDTAGNGFLNYRDDHALRLNGGTITRSLVGSTGATGVSAVLSLTSATSSGKALANNAQLTIDGLPPTVTRISVSSAPSSTVTRGNEVVIGISFSALVTVDTTKGTPTLQMDVGSYNRQAVYKSGSGSQSLLFSYIVSLGDTAPNGVNYRSRSALVLNGATIRRASNSPTLDAYLMLPDPPSLSPQIIVDRALSSVTTIKKLSADVVTGTYGTKQVITLSLTFSDEVALSGIMPPALKINTGTVVPYASGSSTRTLVFLHIVKNGEATPGLDKFDDNAVICTAPNCQIINYNAQSADLSLTGISLEPANIVIDTSAPQVVSVYAVTTAPTVNGGSFVVGDVIEIVIKMDLEVFIEPPPSAYPEKAPVLLLNTVKGGKPVLCQGYAYNDRHLLLFKYTVEPGDVATDLMHIDQSALTLNSGQSSIKRFSTTPTTNAVLTLPVPQPLGASLNVNGNKVPAVLSVSSPTANDLYRCGDQIALTVSFSQHVVVKGAPFLWLDMGAVPRKALYNTGSGTTVLTFIYTVQEGDYSVDMEYVDHHSLDSTISVNDTTPTAILHLSTNPTTVADVNLPYPFTQGSLSYNKNLQVNGRKPSIVATRFTSADGLYKFSDTGVLLTGYGAGLTVRTERDGQGRLSGFFRLQFRTDIFPNDETDDIPVGASDHDVEVALEKLVSVNDVNAKNDYGPVIDTSGNLPALVPVITKLKGTNARVVVQVGGYEPSSLSADSSSTNAGLPGGSAGMAAVFTRGNNDWKQQGGDHGDDSGNIPDLVVDSSALTKGAGVGSAQMHEYSAGTFRSDGSSAKGLQCGAAYIFTRDKKLSTWSEYTKVAPPAAQIADVREYGGAVALSDPFAVVGAPGAYNEAGRVFVYHFNGVDKWLLFQTLSAAPNVITSGDRFGESVAISGTVTTTVVVGAPGYASNSGAVFVFDLMGGYFQNRQMLMQVVPEMQPGDRFGNALDLDMLFTYTLVVAAHRHTYQRDGAVDAVKSGMVLVFVRRSSNDIFFVLQQVLYASDIRARDRFGTSIAVAKDTIIVGAHELYEGEQTTRKAVQALTASVLETEATNSIQGGSFTLSFLRSNAGEDPTKVTTIKRVETRAIAYDISSSGLQAILETDFDLTNVIVRRDGPSASKGYTWYVTFAGSSGEIPLLEVDNTQLKGGEVTVKWINHLAPVLRGSAYVFTRDGSGKWTEQASFFPRKKQYFAWFGSAVAVHKRTAVIGAPNLDTYISGINSGGAFVGDLGILSVRFSAKTYNVLEGDSLDVTVQRCSRLGGFCAVDVSAAPQLYIEYDTGDAFSDRQSASTYVAVIPTIGPYRKLSSLDASGRQGSSSVFYAKDVMGQEPFPQVGNGRWLTGDAVGTANGRNQFYGSSERRSLWVDAIFDYAGTSDYPSSSGELFFDGVDDLTHTFSVQTTSDFVVENPDETVMMRLSLPGIWPSVTGDLWSTLTIKDNGDGGSGARSYLAHLNPEPSLAQARSDFSRSVSIFNAGNAAAVGAPLERNNAGVKCGAVHLFVRRSGFWERDATVFPSDCVPGMLFGTSVAIDGSLGPVRAIVGAPGADAAYIYLYRSDGLTPAARWMEETRLDEPTLATDDINHNYAGSNAVTIFGDIAVVGASGLESVYVYHRGVDGLWKLVSTLRASDRVQYQILERTVEQSYAFGHAMDMDKRTIVVGAPFSDAGVFTAQQYHSADFDRRYFAKGAAYVFHLEAQEQRIMLRTSNPLISGSFRLAATRRGITGITRAISYSATGAEVKAALEGTNGTNGQDGDGSTIEALGFRLLEVQRTGSIDQGFTWSVTFIGEIVTVPLMTASWFGYGCSTCKAFSSTFIPDPTRQILISEVVAIGSGWKQQARLTAPDGNAGDQFGLSVGLSGEQAIVGAAGSSALTTTTWDFETGDLTGWLTTGTAFDQQPTYGDNSYGRTNIYRPSPFVGASPPGQRANHEGRYWVGTFEARPGAGKATTAAQVAAQMCAFANDELCRAPNYKMPTASASVGTTQGDGPQGTLTSLPFTIKGQWMSFRVGGGCDIRVVYVELLIDGQPAAVSESVAAEQVAVEVTADGASTPSPNNVRPITATSKLRATGRCRETMQEVTWGLSAFENRTAQIRVVDASSNLVWGHINFDDVRFSWGAARVAQTSTSKAGAAYTFRRRAPGTQFPTAKCEGMNRWTCEWEFQARLAASDKRSEDLFGSSVAVDDVLGVAVVAAPGQRGVDANNTIDRVLSDGLDISKEGLRAMEQVGSLYVFRRADEVRDGAGVLLRTPKWAPKEVLKMQYPQKQRQSHFGAALDLDGSDLIVGAPGIAISPVLPQSGRAFAYDLAVAGVKFTNSWFACVEGNADGLVGLTLSRSAATSNLTRPLTIGYATEDRSAVGVDALKFATCMKVPSTQRKDCGDYQQIAGEVTFAAGETSKLVTIPIMEDMCLEQWEKHFVVRLQVPGGEPLLGEDFIARCSKASAMEFAAKSSDEPEKELGPAELCTRLKTSLPIGTRHRTPLKKFPNCFSSVEAVNWMLEHKQARGKSEAVRKCQTLLSQRLIEQVDGPAEFEVNAKRFYRFKPAEAS
ncbi:hypothetical protein JG688_00008480 [Phytophthora aleatoria]|uniref:DEP domain-containing protein n=1 Tax=Phytophthora aleatoria TaxID=2496075 RepID=A0A8J5INH0_9STRA|nr:hypothetical protein JG688_00008480 [Phytophthora aleatoria]